MLLREVRASPKVPHMVGPPFDRGLPSLCLPVLVVTTSRILGPPPIPPLLELEQQEQPEQEESESPEETSSDSEHELAMCRAIHLALRADGGPIYNGGRTFYYR